MAQNEDFSSFISAMITILSVPHKLLGGESNQCVPPMLSTAILHTNKMNISLNVLIKCKIKVHDSSGLSFMILLNLRI